MTGSDREHVAEVMVIEDVRDVREGLVALIDAQAGLRCARGYRTMEQALAEVERDRPDVVLTDLGLPGMSGVEGIQVLRRRFPGLPVIALTVYDNDDQIFRALCAGAAGYLLKNTTPRRLLDSIRDVLNGGVPMSPEVARRVLQLFRDFKPPARAACHLTPQETELLRLLVDGHQKKTCAREMHISVNTVSFHLKNIYAKLEVHSKSEAVAKAFRERLL